MFYEPNIALNRIVSSIAGVVIVSHVGSMLRTPPRILAVETQQSSPSGLTDYSSSPVIPISGDTILISPSVPQTPRRNNRRRRRGKFVRSSYYRKFITHPTYYRLPK